MTYRGTIAIIESDPEARTAKMLAKGAEERGQGTAQATLHDGRHRARGRRLARDGLRRHARDRPRRADGARCDAGRRPPHDRPDGAEHGGAAHWRRTGRAGGRRLGGIAAGLGRRRSREAHLRLAGRSSGPLAALAGYALLSLALFGRGVLREGGGSVVGSYGSDQASFAWSLAWWPHAIEHGLHPLLTDLVYAPDGWNLAWTSSIPGPSLLAWPLTAVFGPVATYDVLALAAPALAAWCTYLLCRELGTGTPAALAGGLVFGFGTYEAAETLNHLNLALVFTLPLAGLVVARYLRGALSDRRFVALFALCVARRVRDVPGDALLGDARRRLRAGRRAHLHARRASARCCSAASLLCALAYAIALLAAAPYLWVALAHPDPLGISGHGYELDLANLIVPTRVTALRPPLAARPGRAARRQQPHRAARLPRPGAAGARRASRSGSGGAQPLARVLALDDRRRDGVRARLAPRRGRAPHLARAAVDARRRPSAREPRAARARVRARLARARRGRGALPRAAPALRAGSSSALLALTLAPSLDGSLWVTRLDRPALFEGDRWRSVVHPDENVLTIPLSYDGQAMLWQEEAGFGFRLTGGYVSATLPDGAVEVPDRARDLRGADAAVPGARGTRAHARSRRRRRAPPQGQPGAVGERAVAPPSGRRARREACSPGGCAAPGRPR